jgi:hypothetical protein
MMLTQLTTVKTRLALDPLTTTYDELLLRAIVAVSARFDQETGRTLARTEDATYEFPAEDREILVSCYPIESVRKFEIKNSETGGWIQQSDVDYLIRRGCVLSLATSLDRLRPNMTLQGVATLARVTYTGGYLLPGSADLPAATRLPAELEHAAIEQTSFWFQTRDQLGIIRQWPRGGSYQQFADTDLLSSVREVLRGHTRFVL